MNTGLITGILITGILIIGIFIIIGFKMWLEHKEKMKKKEIERGLKEDGTRKL